MEWISNVLESFLFFFIGFLVFGILIEKDFIFLYCKFRGFGDIYYEYWNFYIVLLFFRMVVIV